MKPPPPLGAAVPIYDTNEFLHRPAIPRRKSERIPTRGPIADRREYVVVLSFVSLRPAENASTVCGGTMQPSAWGGCGLPLSGRSRRANLLQSLVLAESECESVGNILNVYPEASRTSDWASPARSSFHTFCHRKVAPKVSARRKAAGNSQRLAKTGACRGFASKPAPFFNARRCSFLFPHFSQGGDCCALRATMIYYDSNSSILKFSKPPRAEASARAAPWRRSVAAVDNTPPRQSRIKFALFSA